MDKLVALVAEKTGLSKEHSTAAVEVVVAYIKTKLPDSIAGQLDGLIDSDDDAEGGSDVMGMVKGLF